MASQQDKASYQAGETKARTEVTHLSLDVVAKLAIGVALTRVLNMLHTYQC